MSLRMIFLQLHNVKGRVSTRALVFTSLSQRLSELTTEASRAQKSETMSRWYRDIAAMPSLEKNGAA